MAFSLTPTGGKETSASSASTLHGCQRDARTVFLSGPNITVTHFPSLDAGAGREEWSLVRTFLPPYSSILISLDRWSVRRKVALSPHGFRSQRPADIFVSYGPRSSSKLTGSRCAWIPKTNSNRGHSNGRSSSISESNYYLFTEKRAHSGPTRKALGRSPLRFPRHVQVKSDPQWSDCEAIPPPSSNGAVPTVFLYSTSPRSHPLSRQPVYSKISGHATGVAPTPTATSSSTLRRSSTTMRRAVVPRRQSSGAMDLLTDG